MSNEKEKLNEGRVERFLDKVFYSILNGINNKIVSAIKSDPEMEEKIDNFKEAQEELNDALSDFAENPERYFDDLDKGDLDKGEFKYD